jgi:hypothetical protein
MKHQKESMSRYRNVKFKFKDSFARNMFSRSSLDYETSEGVYEFKFNIKESLARNMFNRSNMDYYMANKTSEGVNMFRKFKFIDYTARNMFNR